MPRHRAFWRLALILPLLITLLLMGLTGCYSRCEGDPGPNLDPHLLSANGVVYFDSPASHSLYAINMSNGSIRWTYQASGSTFLDNGVIYVDGHSDYQNPYTITALNASDGTQLWQKDGRDGSSFSTLAAAIDHIAYIATSDNATGNSTLKAVNGRDGSVLWQHEGAPSTLQVSNGIVYLSMGNSSVFALRESDGTLHWQFHAIQGDGLYYPNSTALGDGIIFISSDQTYALRMSDGKLLWRSAHKGALLEANGMLYLYTFRFPNPEDPTRTLGEFDSFFALWASDGRQVWYKSFAPTNLESAQSAQNYDMQLMDNVLYILSRSSGHLFALRASDGKQLWDYTPQTARFSLVSSQGIVYIFSWKGLEALREADGSSVWSSPLQQAGLFVTNNAIYVGTAGNTTDPCGPFRSAQMERLRLSDASQIWHIKFNPAPDPPDPSLPVKIVLFILGGLLSFLGLLVFFVSRKRHTNDWLPQPHQEEIVLVVPAPRIKSIGWLLLFIPGVILLLVAAYLFLV